MGGTGLANDPHIVREYVGLCQPIVKSLAWQISRRLPASVDRDDLISEGQVGLMKAVKSFDPSKGVQFSTFAYHRIRGSMLDWCRAQRWFNWHDYHAGTLEEGETAATESTDSDDESRASAPPPAVRRTGRVDEANLIDDTEADPAESAENDEMRLLLLDIVGNLDGDCGQILRSTLLDGQTLQTAGETIGVSRGWAQRLQTKGFNALASALAEKNLATLSGEEIRTRLNANRMGGRRG